MIYLVDANILSEATRPAPSSKVVAWLRDNERDIAVDPIILGEVRYGIFLLPAGAKRRKLEHWFVQVVQKIRCLPFDAATGMRWAQLIAKLRLAGTPMSIKDSLIAATALTHDLHVATHNTSDFARSGVKLIDPYNV